MKDKHHRRPKWFGGTADEWNMKTVDAKRHSAFHYLFRVHIGKSGIRPMSPEEIAHDLSETWIDPSYKIIIQRR